MKNREAIYSALYARMQNIAGITTTSRKLRHWSDVGASEQPAIFCVQGNQNAQPGEPVRGVPTKWILSADVYVYVRTDGDQVPGTVMNPIIDAIDAIMQPDNVMQKTQTLGGLVERCWIEGDIQTDEGALGDQAVAIVPIRMLVS